MIYDISALTILCAAAATTDTKTVWCNKQLSVTPEVYEVEHIPFSLCSSYKHNPTTWQNVCHSQ